MSTPSEGSVLKRVARAPFVPALEHIDSRIASLLERIDSLLERIDGLEQRVVQGMAHQHAEAGGWINFWGQRQEQHMLELRDRIHADAQAAVQSGAFAERMAEEVACAIARMETRMECSQAGCDTVAWANRVLAHDGPVAQAGLWFNPPVVVRYTGRGAELVQVQERIVEVPFVFQTLAAVAPGGAVLDVGSAESTVAFSLASLGFKTIALEPRGYPLQHPNLVVVSEDISRWAGPGDGSLDAIVCLSTLEHLGLKAYGSQTNDSDLDRQTMARFRTWLKPGGVLALTVPYGRPAVSDFERTYGREQLDALLAGWKVDSRRVFTRPDRTTWQVRDESAAPWPEGVAGVALVSAIKA